MIIKPRRFMTLSNSKSPCGLRILDAYGGNGPIKPEMLGCAPVFSCRPGIYLWYRTGSRGVRAKPGYEWGYLRNN